MILNYYGEYFIASSVDDSTKEIAIARNYNLALLYFLYNLVIKLILIYYICQLDFKKKLLKDIQIGNNSM